MSQKCWITELQTVGDTRFITAGFVLRSGEFAKSGIKINYCPFCGTKILGGIGESGDYAHISEIAERGV